MRLPSAGIEPVPIQLKTKLLGPRSLALMAERDAQVARGPFAGWRVALLVASPELAAQLGLALQERFVTSNGGIRVRLAASD